MVSVNRGSTLRLKATWKDFLDAYVDPSAQTITLTPPTGAPIDAGAPTKSDTGIYYNDYVVGAAAVTGLWGVSWKATIATKDEILIGYFDVV